MICFIVDKKSSRSNLPFCIFLAVFSASASSIASVAFSTKETISPIPSILPAILSGSNVSKPSIFSLTPINLIGILVKCLTDKATPPLVSPSSFVKITPVKGSASKKPVITFIASCPIIESITSKVSCGLISFWISSSSFIKSSSI